MKTITDRVRRFSRKELLGWIASAVLAFSAAGARAEENACITTKEDAPLGLSSQYSLRSLSAAIGCPSEGLRTGNCNWVRMNDPAHPDNPIYLNEGAKFTVPLHLTDKDMSLLGAAGVATVIAFASEREMLDFVQKNRGKVADRTARFGEGFGSKAPFIVAGAGYVYGVITDNEKVKEFATIVLEAGIVTSLVNDALKIGFHRALPGDSKDPFARGKSNRPPDLAFPSGHTSAAFSLATVIAEKTKDQSSIIPILAYGAATITAWERMYDNQHWASDVIAGAVVGHLVAKAVMAQGKSERNLEVVPYVTKDRAGVLVNFHEKDTDVNRPCGGRLQGAARIEACFRQALRNP